MLNVVVFCGGVSAEHEISLRSAKNIIQAIDKTKFKPVLVIISRAGTWYLQNNLTILDQITECSESFNYGESCTLIRQNQQTFLLDTHGKKTLVNVAFPILHGPMGEDGTLQGLLEVMNLAYVGCGVLASVLGMDKDSMKKILLSAGLPVVPSVTLLNNSDHLTYDIISKSLNSKTLFVKPAMMGSSVGVSKVTSAEQYLPAVQQAFKYSTKVLVEKFVPCREIECAILGNNNPQASCLGEIRPLHDFYSYEAKYLDPNGAELIIPADLDADTAYKMRNLAIKTFIALECQGLSRVDFFLSDKNEIFVNEINTMPGFTSISMYPKLWEASGIGYSELISELINLALEAHQVKQQICLTPDHQTHELT